MVLVIRARHADGWVCLTLVIKATSTDAAKVAAVADMLGLRALQAVAWRAHPFAHSYEWECDVLDHGLAGGSSSSQCKVGSPAKTASTEPLRTAR